MYFHRQWYPPPPLISYIITHQNPKSTPIVPLCELAQCLLPGSKNWGMMGSQPRENPMAKPLQRSGPPSTAGIRILPFQRTGRGIFAILWRKISVTLRSVILMGIILETTATHPASQGGQSGKWHTLPPKPPNPFYSGQGHTNDIRCVKSNPR